MVKGWAHRSLSGEAPGERRRAGPLSARVWCGWGSAGTALRREWSWCEHVRDCGTPGRNAVFSLGRIPLRAPILPVQPRGGCGCRGLGESGSASAGLPPPSCASSQLLTFFLSHSFRRLVRLHRRPTLFPPCALSRITCCSCRLRFLFYQRTFHH